MGNDLLVSVRLLVYKNIGRSLVRIITTAYYRTESVFPIGHKWSKLICDPRQWVIPEKNR